ncbi:TraB/GumN family protein [Flavisolibacter nicotianae]|uniref:TraB/GumN family protein n=1 Tax=Flavisolibacter nicotianae TaxID=2364882 RepID=UPI000EABE2DF|nr:TraB/GumN family protein [Flavisolibacter nicotianae]
MTTAYLRHILASCACLFYLSGFSQKIPSTLLWRISGNGLSTPSYLYGTMHLQDKRLFQFGDSVYHALETTAGFATEVDFSAFMDSLMSNKAREAEEDFFLSKQAVSIDRSKLSGSADSLLKKFGVKGNTVSKKQLKKIRDYRMQKYLQKGEMPTIVDGFLLGLALRQDKWTGGIEDIGDQLDVLDEVGRDLKPEEVLAPEKKMNEGIEEMIRTYTSQDLEKLDHMINYGTRIRDLVLTRRNVKMAYRMDSLSQVRSSFFAVGAAHLPGDSGVIALLRSRGFSVDPVFSSSTTFGNDYAQHLKERPWKSITGDAGIYTVQMPFKGADIKMFGNLVNMKMCFDLPNNTFYMVGHSTSYAASSMPLDDIVKNMAKNMGDSKAQYRLTAVSIAGLQGKETVLNNEESSFRIQTYVKDKVLFLLLVGSPRKDRLFTTDAARFFNSFIPGQTNIKNNWQDFTLAEKGLKVRMPGRPEPLPALDAGVAQKSNWVFLSHQAVDPETGYYYLAQVKQLKPGYYLPKDSVYFEQVKKEMEGVGEITASTIGTYHGRPALYLNYFIKKVNGTYHTLHVIRGNRVYTLIAGAPKGADSTDVQHYLESMELLPYRGTTFSTHGAAGFSATSPSDFQTQETDSLRPRLRVYTSTNPANAVTYQVMTDVFDSLYWIKSDTSYFNSKIGDYSSDGDTVLRKNWISVGNLKGIDFVVQPLQGSLQRRVRMFISRDTLYTLFGSYSAEDSVNPDHDAFFNSFRLTDGVAPTMYTSRSRQLLQALASTDSAQIANAQAIFKLVSFNASDLPLLHQALLVSYRDTLEGLNNTVDQLIGSILPMADSTTVQFIETTYPKLGREKDELKLDLLYLLAKTKTARSYAAIKQLLLQMPPQKGYYWRLRGALTDSLQLTATLFPQLLSRSTDSLLTNFLPYLANNLVDSNLLSRDALLPYTDSILTAATQALNSLKNEKNRWELAAWTTLLGHLNTPSSKALLSKFLLLKDPYTKQQAIMALLQAGETVPLVVLTTVAADVDQRFYFYEALKKAGKGKLFPAVYATEAKLAESKAYHLFTNDYEPADFTLVPLGARTAPYEGKKRVFQLFKVRLALDGEAKKEYLVVVGPQQPANEEEDKATGYYSDETYKPAATGRLLQKYLLSLTNQE